MTDTEDAPKETPMTIVRGLSVVSLAALVVAGTEGAAVAAKPEPGVSSGGSMVHTVAASRAEADAKSGTADDRCARPC